MPLKKTENFWTKIGKQNRVMIPALIRWKHKLDPGEVLQVQVYSEAEGWSENFYAKMFKDGRLTVPKIIVELMNISRGDKIAVQLSEEENESALTLIEDIKEKLK